MEQEEIKDLYKGKNKSKEKITLITESKIFD
jgi:hypothetical protein